MGTRHEFNVLFILDEMVDNPNFGKGGDNRRKVSKRISVPESLLNGCSMGHLKRKFDYPDIIEWGGKTFVFDREYSHYEEVTPSNVLTVDLPFGV